MLKRTQDSDNTKFIVNSVFPIFSTTKEGKAQIVFDWGPERQKRMEGLFSCPMRVSEKEGRQDKRTSERTERRKVWF